MRTRTIAAGLAAATLLTLTACSSDADPAAEAPPYKVVQQDKSGNVRQVTVEVDSTEKLQDVFDAVAADLTDEAGYHVWINCSTGSTSGSDNRLGNGRKAVGSIGQATTGMDEGSVEFEPLKGASCP